MEAHVFYMMKKILTLLEEKDYKISRPTLQQYEKNGLIQTPACVAVTENGKKIRLYTKQEIDENVALIIAYINQKKAKTLI